MELNDNFCSKEQAQKLRELGVKQESMFYYGNGTWVVYRWTEVNDITRKIKEGEFISAFTAGELGELIPPEIEYKGDTYQFGSNMFSAWLTEEQEGYMLQIEKEGSADIPFNFGGKDKTEAVNRAEMLIALLVNEIVTIENVN